MLPVAILLLLIGSTQVLAGSSSASYVLRRTAVDAGGDAASSASFRLTASAGTESAIGTSSSPSFLLQSGFWSFVGSGSIDVVLAVDRSDGSRERIDLQWSGNDPPYDIFVAADCTDVFGSFYGSTSHNFQDAIGPPPVDLACMNVLPLASPPATAPGRMQEPKPKP